MRTGFTLIELLIVISVIAALAAMSYPVLTGIRAKSDINATRQLVHAVSAAIANYNSLLSAITDKTGHLQFAWALGQDQTQSYPNDPRWMDGDPRLYTAADVLMVSRAPTWYTGFVQMTGFPLPAKTGLDQKGRIKDRWGQPIHIEWKADTYGSGGYGVWSTGPDGRQSTETSIAGTTADDICSWKSGDG